ncbi:MAG: hypothetical protein FWD80_04200, partial [Propionibacteriaceae bacterium]|nr:hypothetical protein [Propionibacteriaceae bacterium]
MSIATADRPLRMVIAAPLAIAFGAVTGLGFQPIGWWWATIVGFAGFVWLLHELRARRAFALGYLYGLGLFGMTAWWVSNFGWWMPLALVGFLALWAALAGWATAWTTTHGPAWVTSVWPLVAACSWTATEWLSQRIPFGGFCWSRFVYTVADQPMGGLLPIFGAGGVSFLVALTGACLAWIVCSRTVRLRLGNLVLVVALMVAGGALRWWPSP